MVDPETYPSVVLFDGYCNLCSGSVTFIMKRDRRKQFRFAALQTEPGIFLRKYLRIPDSTDSVILWKGGKVYIHSDAALEIARHLRFPWPLAGIFRMVPKALRDRIYLWVATNRYQWFGKRAYCRIPGPDERFLFPSATDLQLQIARLETMV
jgi:predicted DCC family thiol-disulfide oxidoreductase YuxK